MVAVDRQGNYYVAPTYNTGEIARFDSRGRYTGKFGREGRGPGEFGPLISRIRVGPGDSVHVFEGNRHTVLAPGLRSVASVRMLPVMPHDIDFFSDGRMVVQSLVAGSGGIGQPLHVVGPDGQVVRSFGGTHRWNPKKIYQRFRALAPGSHDQMWSAHAGEYRIDLWGPDGATRLSLARSAGWFSPWGDRVESYEEAVRHPRIVDVAEDGRGRLWVNISVPDPDWRPGDRGRETPVEEVAPDSEQDTIIEVLDPVRRRLIARARFDESFNNFVGNGPFIWSSGEDREGNKLLRVWRVRLSTSGGGNLR
ncbi:MAG TPA: hypothetical protein VFQ76_00405 [Longimicrobiaceae bacterium]|nr:hypothetical protein [Longimicrobiaceae bacterium]